MATATRNTNWEGLLPQAVSDRVIESAIKESVVLQLATRQPMPAYVEQIPVVSSAPSASWVAAGGRKPLTAVDWSAETLKAEELAAVTSLPDAMLTDTSGSWDPEQSVETELAKAIARTLDAAVLFGIDAPASYPKGGIAAIAGKPVEGADALEALDGALTQLEADGLIATAIASSSKIGSALRLAYREAAALPGEAAANTVFGIPVSVTAPWPATAADAYVGDWANVVVGIREDINFARSSDGVLLDENGDIQVSAFQDDVTLIRVFARFAVAVARPLRADGDAPSTPFVGASWTTAK